MSWNLFDVYGIELEYMLVDRRTLDVWPRADLLLTQPDGTVEAELERGKIAWSNELVLHVIELKTNGPTASMEGLADDFQSDLRVINERVASAGGRLMPGAMHPWMDPSKEMVLWPHEYGPVYEAFDRIFSCKGHGWSNLQSAHLNLPFGNAEQFGRLHAAIRMVLPLIPALAASSPVVEGKPTGQLDSRLTAYRGNCRRLPSVSGHVVPERVFSPEAYEREILERIYADIAPLDPEGTLQHEWLNARGAIARFDRDALEIRVVDVQECPRMDLAVLGAIADLVRRLCDPAVTQSLRHFDERRLLGLLEQTIQAGERAQIDDLQVLGALGLRTQAPMSAGQVWRELLAGRKLPYRSELDLILERGPLARRLLEALGQAPDRARLHEVYARLCDCVGEGLPFD